MTQSTLAQTKKMNKSTKHTKILKAEIQRSEVVALQKVLIESTIKGNGANYNRKQNKQTRKKMRTKTGQNSI